MGTKRDGEKQAHHAAKAGVEVAIGKKLSEAEKQKIVDTMIGVMLEVLDQGKLEGLADELMVTDPLPHEPKPELITFSGGVAEFIFEREAGDRQDLGRLLGREWHKETVYGVASRAYATSPNADDPWITSHLELRDDTGRVNRVLCSMRDVTERKKLEDQARDLYHQLLQAEKLAALGQTMSGVAHELNNPLATVLACAERLSGKPLDDGLRRDVDAIYNAAERAARIVRNLQTFARKRHTTRTMVDINHVVRDTLALRAYEQRVANVVILEALVDPEGRVKDVKVLRSVPLLDKAAIDAVLQWRYSPVVLNGTPVPFILTVVVSFSLPDAKPRGAAY